MPSSLSRKRRKRACRRLVDFGFPNYPLRCLVMWKALDKGSDNRMDGILCPPTRSAFIPYVQREERHEYGEYKPAERNGTECNGTRKRLSPVITRRTRFFSRVFSCIVLWSRLYLSKVPASITDKSGDRLRSIRRQVRTETRAEGLRECKLSRLAGR